MDLNDLISVVEAYRMQSFSEAAEQLAYTPSAISKHIKRVEESLGFPIFIRGDKLRQVRLTAEGRAVMPLIQQLVTQHSDLMFLANALRANGEQGQLRIGYPYLIGTFGEVDILSAFMKDHPNVRVETTRAIGHTLIEMVAARRLDAAFLFIVGEFDPHKYCMKANLTGLDITLCNVIHGMYVGISANSPLASRSEITLSDMIDCPIAVWKNPNEQEAVTETLDDELLPTYRSMRFYLKYCEANGFTPKVRFFNAMSHNVFQLAAAGEVAIPVMRVGYTYEGVKFVRVTDWDNVGSLYFVTQHGNDSPALRKLRVSVGAFAAERLPPP